MCRGTQRQSMSHQRHSSAIMVSSEALRAPSDVNQSQSVAITWRICSRRAFNRNQSQSVAISRNHLAHLLEEGIQSQSIAISRNQSQSPGASARGGHSIAINRNQSQSVAITWRICSRRAFNRNQSQSVAISRNHLAHLLEEGERLVPQPALGTRRNGSTEADHIRAHAPSSHLPQEIESSRELAALFTRRDRGRV